MPSCSFTGITHISEKISRCFSSQGRGNIASTSSTNSNIATKKQITKIQKMTTKAILRCPLVMYKINRLYSIYYFQVFSFFAITMHITLINVPLHSATILKDDANFRQTTCLSCGISDDCLFVDARFSKILI